ncbi:MFS transporter [Streptomyces sp. 1222.5]|uniref:MFS transporter n=1 Tax=Streptomyces sp. 1222.5 TaxID=1881026 RepID=UPI003EBCDC14
MRKLFFTLRWNRKWSVLAIVAGTQAMSLIDTTIVAVSLPSVQRDFNVSTTSIHWIINAYSLSFASLVALGGRLGDTYGYARIFRLGVVIFVSASFACGASPSEGWLLAARTVQGAGAALITPATAVLIISVFRKVEQGKAMGIYAAIARTSLVLGPLLGGLLTQAFSWRFVFFFNIPMGVIIASLAYLILPEDQPCGGTIDWFGALLLALGLVALTLAFMQSRAWGWISLPVVALLAGSMLLLVLFYRWEHSTESPLIHLTIFRNHSFTADAVVVAAMQGSGIGVTVFGVIWVQDILGLTPIKAGLTLLPLMLPMILIAPRVGSFYDRFGARTLLLLGTGAVAAALALLGFFVRSISYWPVVPCYVLLGLGLAAATTPASVDGLRIVPSALRGQADGIMESSRRIGATLGISVLGTIVSQVQLIRVARLLERQENFTMTRAEKVERSMVAAPNGSMPSDISPALFERLRVAVTDGISSAYYVAAILLLFVHIVVHMLAKRRSE